MYLIVLFFLLFRHFLHIFFFYLIVFVFIHLFNIAIVVVFAGLDPFEEYCQVVKNGEIESEHEEIDTNNDEIRKNVIKTCANEEHSQCRHLEDPQAYGKDIQLIKDEVVYNKIEDASRHADNQEHPLQYEPHPLHCSGHVRFALKNGINRACEEDAQNQHRFDNIGKLNTVEFCREMLAQTRSFNMVYEVVYFVFNDGHMLFDVPDMLVSVFCFVLGFFGHAIFCVSFFKV